MKSVGKKTAIALVVLIFLPLIVLGLIIGAFVIFFDWLKEPGRKKEYEKSHYFLDFQVPYRKGIILERGYKFYNEAKNNNLPVNMIHSSEGADYLLVQDRLYLFPMCPDVYGGIAYHTGEKAWKVDFDGDFESLDDEWEKHKAKLGTIAQEKPSYLLIRKVEVLPSFDDKTESLDDYALDCLPSYVRLVGEYKDCITGQ